MARFLTTHRMTEDFTDAQVREGYATYCTAAQTAGLTPVGAIYNLEHRIAYCQTDANTAQDVRDAHQSVDIPTEDVYEITTIEPA